MVWAGLHSEESCHCDASAFSVLMPECFTGTDSPNRVSIHISHRTVRLLVSGRDSGLMIIYMVNTRTENLKIGIS